MDWFSQPLTHFWGVPSFWIVRIAKVCQFLSGLVIVIEIVGKERIEEFAAKITKTLETLARAEPLRQLSRDLWLTSKYFLLYLVTTGDKERRYLDLSNSAKYDTPAMRISFCLTPVITAIYCWVNFEANTALVWKIPVVLFFANAASFVIVYLMAINVILLLIFVIVRPIDFVFDIFSALLARLLRHGPLSRTLFLVSLLLLIVSFIAEIAAS